MNDDIQYVAPEEKPNNIRSLTLKGFAHAKGPGWSHLGRVRRDFHMIWQKHMAVELKTIVDSANQDPKFEMPARLESERIVEYGVRVDKLHEQYPDILLADAGFNGLKPPYEICLTYNGSRHEPSIILDINNNANIDRGDERTLKLDNLDRFGFGELKFFYRAQREVLKFILETKFSNSDVEARVNEALEKPLEGSQIFSYIASMWLYMDADSQSRGLDRVKTEEYLRKKTHADFSYKFSLALKQAQYVAGSRLQRFLCEAIASGFPHPQNPIPYSLMARAGYDVRGLRPL